MAAVGGDVLKMIEGEGMGGKLLNHKLFFYFIDL
jgi:hypothetical protein